MDTIRKLSIININILLSYYINKLIKSNTYPETIPPTRINITYMETARFLINDVNPAITHALVADPVIKNASIAPWLAPLCIMD